MSSIFFDVPTSKCVIQSEDVTSECVIQSEDVTSKCVIQSEDDQDSSVISEQDPGTPKPTNTDSSTQTNWTEDGVFKIPPNKEEKTDEELANIALRTRSRVSLTDTPLEVIEESFIPPDITTGMYDMDCDDEDWAEFLKTFTKPLDEVVKAAEDEDHDPEYNFLADETDKEVDKEELRADKAVKVTKKELNDLVAELFDYTDNYSDLEVKKAPEGSQAPLSTPNVVAEVQEVAEVVMEASVKTETPVSLTRGYSHSNVVLSSLTLRIKLRFILSERNNIRVSYL